MLKQNRSKKVAKMGTVQKGGHPRKRKIGQPSKKPRQNQQFLLDTTSKKMDELGGGVINTHKYLTVNVADRPFDILMFECEHVKLNISPAKLIETIHYIIELEKNLCCGDFRKIFNLPDAVWEMYNRCGFNFPDFFCKLGNPLQQKMLQYLAKNAPLRSINNANLCTE